MRTLTEIRVFSFFKVVCMLNYCWLNNAMAISMHASLEFWACIKNWELGCSCLDFILAYFIAVSWIDWLKLASNMLQSLASTDKRIKSRYYCSIKYESFVSVERDLLYFCYPTAVLTSKQYLRIKIHFSLIQIARLSEEPRKCSDFYPHHVL